MDSLETCDAAFDRLLSAYTSGEIGLSQLDRLYELVARRCVKFEGTPERELELGDVPV